MADAVCETYTDAIRENQDMRVITAKQLSRAIRSEVEQSALSLTDASGRVARTCSPGVDVVALMAYGGFGPLADQIHWSMSRGTCGPRGDYGGVISVPASAGGSYSVELALEYEVRGIKEHDTTQYTDVAAGDSASFEFFMPSDLPRGGECDVQLISVAPER